MAEATPALGAQGAPPDLDPTSLSLIFMLLDDPEDLAAASAVCSLWRTAASSNTVWTQRLEVDFGVEDDGRCAYWDGPPPPCLPRNTPRTAWLAWNSSFGITGSRDQARRRRAAVRRICCSIIRLKEGLRRLGMESALDTLVGGLSPDLLDELEKKFAVRLPLALRTLWTCTAGQVIPPTNGVASSCYFWGVLGSYGFYRHIRSIRLLHCSDVAHATQALHERESLPSNMLLLAANYDYKRQVLIDCDDGTLHIFPSRTPPHYQPASPALLPGEDCGLEPRDAPLVLWLENYTQVHILPRILRLHDVLLRP